MRRTGESPNRLRRFACVTQTALLAHTAPPAVDKANYIKNVNFTTATVAMVWVVLGMLSCEKSLPLVRCFHGNSCLCEREQLQRLHFR